MMDNVLCIGIDITLFNTFGDKYFITINGYKIMNPVCKGLIEVFCINHYNKFIFISNIIKKYSLVRKKPKYS